MYKIQFSYLLFIFIILLHNEQCKSWPIQCPEICACSHYGASIQIDCSNRNLYVLPELPDYQDIGIFIDLSNNYFTEIPNDLQKINRLVMLFLTNNHISNLPSNALINFPNLDTLRLNKNNITNWSDINLRSLLLPATSLTTLDLSDNLIMTDDNLLLVSDSLKYLKLDNCNITNIIGDYLIKGLPKLIQLSLNDNPIRQMPSLISNSLQVLKLKNTYLAQLQPNVFRRLPNLIYVLLARNHRLSLKLRAGEFVTSDSLKTIDLSFCNMAALELDGFPDLITVNLRGNMIQQLNSDSFRNNAELENIDLSLNAISSIATNTFERLKRLKHVDLSFNMISRIERETFSSNDILTYINLSRNYIGRFNKIIGKSISHLNMSWCEIMHIDTDALTGMPDLQELDLSNNLMSYIPEYWMSDSLQTIDLSMCRIATITNTTFRRFPELTSLSLAGNRFTTPFRVSFFQEIQYLRNIWLGDNPWRCDCRDRNFQEFFQTFTEPLQRINDMHNLRCGSPEELFGQTWMIACSMYWYPNSGSMGTAEKIWTFLMLIIIVVSGCICVILSIKRCIEGRKMTLREEERSRFLEEQRQVMRENRLVLEQEGQANAPDPRESHPPCYEDAILLPRLDGSFASLDELSSRRSKRKCNADKNENENENNDEVDGVITRRNRCRSEEVLSMRESAIVDGHHANRRYSRGRRRETRPITAAVPASVPPATDEIHEIREIQNENTAHEPQANELHYHSTDILRMNHMSQPSATISSGPSTPIQGQRSTSSSAAVISNENIFKSNDASPYAQRKVTHLSSFRRKEPFKVAASTHNQQEQEQQQQQQQQLNQDEIVVVDDYFSNGNNNRDIDIDSMSSFASVTLEENDDDGIIMIKNKTNDNKVYQAVDPHGKYAEHNQYGYGTVMVQHHNQPTESSL